MLSHESYSTLYSPMHYRIPGSSIHGIFFSFCLWNFLHKMLLGVYNRENSRSGDQNLTRVITTESQASFSVFESNPFIDLEGLDWRRGWFPLKKNPATLLQYTYFRSSSNYFSKDIEAFAQTSGD